MDFSLSSYIFFTCFADIFVVIVISNSLKNLPAILHQENALFLP